MKVGFILPVGSSETGGFGELRELALQAEAVGLDSLWVADHLFHRSEGRTSGIHEAWTLLTAVAAVTSRVEVGTLVLATVFRNPALTAKMALELDEVSAGRLVLGLGCGWHRPEFDAFGYPFDHRVSRFEEVLQVMLPLVRGDRVTFEGRFHSATDAVLVPGPVRDGGPPVLIAAARPRMLELAARHAHLYNSAWHGHPDNAERLHTRLEAVRGAARGQGRDPSTLACTAGVVVRFDDLLESVGGDPAPGGPAEVIRGPVAEVAAALADYADLGVEHLIVRLEPPTAPAVDRLGTVVATVRDRLKARGGRGPG